LAGIQVDLALLYLYAPTSFTSQLQPDVAAAAGVQPYNTPGHLPYYKTLLQNPPEPIRMSELQGNLLDALMCWYVTSEAGPGGRLHQFVLRQQQRAT
jgi:hypothetical protein